MNPKYKAELKKSACEAKEVSNMEWLVKARGKRTQQSVADAVGMSQSGYASIETGARRPSVDTAKRIAAVLGFQWTRFFEEEKEEVS